MLNNYDNSGENTYDKNYNLENMVFHYIAYQKKTLQNYSVSKIVTGGPTL